MTLTTAQAYRARLFTLVGDQDPLDVLARTASRLDDVIRACAVDDLRARPFEGAWTPNEILGHLVDGEWVYGHRLRLILCEDAATILGTNQDAWVQRQRHNDRDPSDHVELFRTLRGFNLTVWRQVTPADLTRTGRHNERGVESLAVMLRMQAGHDLSHLDQIDRYLREIREHGRR